MTHNLNVFNVEYYRMSAAGTGRANGNRYMRTHFFAAWAELTFSRWVSIKNWNQFGNFFIFVTNVQIVSSRISSTEGKVNRRNVSIAWTHLIKMDFIHCGVSVFVSITSTRSSLSEWYTVVTMFLTIWKSDMEFSCFGFIFQHPQAEWLVSTFR